MQDDPPDSLATRLAANVRSLRESRGLTQVRLARAAGIPRATWANIESGSANPTLAVLDRVARALQVTLEELLARPRAEVQRYALADMPSRSRGGVTVQSLLPDAIPGMTFERLSLAAGSAMTGTPHTPGTREYLVCEKGSIVLTASGEKFNLVSGEIVAFRGDQRHGYSNPGTVASVAYSVVVFARG